MKKLYKLLWVLFILIQYGSLNALSTRITDISSTALSYSNSENNLFIGIDYTFSLDNPSWVLAEHSGYVQFSESDSGVLLLPPNVTDMFPQMFFRSQVSQTAIHDFANHQDEIPKFVSNDYIDMEKIGSISRFRSGYGHDYVDDFETCRSMKHYYCPKASVTDFSTIDIFSPITGTVVSMEESNGIRINIKSSSYPEYQFIIFHVNTLPYIQNGYEVEAGEKIGTHINNTINPTISDIAVQRFVLHNNQFKKQLISFFDVMEDDFFASYSAQSQINTRSDLIISDIERNSDLLTCIGEEFVGETMDDGSYGNIPNWIILD